jgi:hypothetical protein
MIFPYELVPKGRGVRARLIQPDEMGRRFPLCKAYLEARRDELDERSVEGGPAAEKQFYQFGRSQSLTKFNGPKIIVQVLTLEARYGFDDLNTLITGGGNGPYYMISSKDNAAVSNAYLMSILNHPLSEAFIRTETSTFRGGYYSHGKQYIEGLPMPIPDVSVRAAIEALVVELVDTLDAVAAAGTPHQRDVLQRQADDLRTRIETSVSTVFGLSEEDMEIVRAVPIPS